MRFILMALASLIAAGLLVFLGAWSDFGGEGVHLISLLTSGPFYYSVFVWPAIIMAAMSKSRVLRQVARAVTLLNFVLIVALHPKEFLNDVPGFFRDEWDSLKDESPDQHLLNFPLDWLLVFGAIQYLIWRPIKLEPQAQPQHANSECNPEIVKEK